MFELRPYNHNKNISSYNYNPFRDIEEMEKHFFDDPSGFFDAKALAEFKTDITDDGKEYQLEADLPGFKKEDIKLDVDGNTLTIKAERHSEFEDKDKKDKYVRCERSYGSYTRQFDISGIDASAIKAKYDGGVLKLTMPKKNPEAEAKKHLEIE